MEENTVVQVGTDERTAELTRWLLNRAGQMDRMSLTSIEPDVDLVDIGLIDSLRFVEFAFLVGKVTGQRLDVERLKLDQFRTLRRITEEFFGDNGSAKGPQK
jgi:Phosphopantetheine attachment site